MRLSTPITLASALLLVLAGACGTERQGNAPRAPQPGVQAEKRIVTESAVLSVTPQMIAPGCALQTEGEMIKRQFSRSYTCPDVERLTNTVGLHVSTKEATDFFDNRWSTMDAARDEIRRNIGIRPVNHDSIKIVDISDSVPKAGAQQERLFCATFDDYSGTVKSTELWGALRYENATVEYTAYTAAEPDCANAAKLRAAALALASAQAKRIREAPLVNQ